MQSDEEVGKVAAAVPVIVSRALELFVENLLTKANGVINQRGSRTLTPSHIKMCIQSEQRFDFLKELVSSVPDLQGDTDCPDTPMSAGIITPGGSGGHAFSSSSSSSTASANAPSTAPANLQNREFVFPPTGSSATTKDSSFGQRSSYPSYHPQSASAQLSGFAAQAAADANSRHHPAYLPSDVRSSVSPAFTLPSRRDDRTTTGRTASRDGTDRGPSELQLHKTQKQYPQAGMQGATANQGAYRKVGRPKKNSPPSSTSGSFGSLQALPIKPKKTSTVTSSVTSPPTNFQRQFSSNNSNAVKRHHSVPSATNGFRNGASSATATSTPSSQYYPVHSNQIKSINHQRQSAASFSQGQAIGHIVDDEDEEDMVPRPHRAANGNSTAALDLSQKNGMEDRGRALNPDAPASSHLQSGLGQDNLPILTTPQFVLSYPSFSVGASVSTAHASAESQQVASVSRGGDTDTALVIDEDYDC